MTVDKTPVSTCCERLLPKIKSSLQTQDSLWGRAWIFLRRPCLWGKAWMDVWRSFVVESGACYHVISWGWPGRNNSCTFRVGPWWEPRMVHTSWSAVHTSGSTLSYIGWFPLKNQSESHLIEWFKCGADPLVSLHPIWCLFVLTHTFGGITYLKPIWCAFVITHTFGR